MPKSNTTFRRQICASITIFLVASVSLLQAEESKSYTALVAAYQGELDNLFAMLEGETIDRVEEIHGAEFHIGEVNGYPIIVFQTGIGLTNAAMTTQMALSHFNIERLLFSGVSGGVDSSLAKGDLVLADRWMIYGFGAVFSEDAEAERGVHIPEFLKGLITEKQYGTYFPYPMAVIRDGMDKPERLPFYPVDDDLNTIFKEVAADVELINAAGKPATILTDAVCASGLAFMDDFKFTRWLREEWEVAAVEMESGAIAQVCWVNEVPFMQIRSISDVIGNKNPNEFYEFKDVAEKNSARLLNLVMQSGKLPR